MSWRLSVTLACAATLAYFAWPSQPLHAATEDDASAPAPRCAPVDAYRGNATFFKFGNGVGACGIGRHRDDVGVAALSTAEYAASANCGACVRVSGPRGVIVARVVDRCVHCKPGDIDLSGSAFDGVAERSKGRVPVTWHYVPCPVAGPLRYHFRRGSTPLRTAVQVRGQRHAVRALAYLNAAGQFVTARRDAYDYFVHPMGSGPYTFRVTDAHGISVIEQGVRHRPAREVAGTVQFGACQP